MTDLIERLEALTAPCRKIDLMIMRYVENIGGDAANALHYTASIDAAMTLIPEGLAWSLYSDGSCEIGREPDFGCLLNAEYTADGATPAIALCIAALKARELNNG